MNYYVYWITSHNKCYIGATTNPNRRLRQHNGEIKGGPLRTLNNGPWSFYCVIVGFRTWNEAIKFEWAFKYYTKRLRSSNTRESALNKLLNKEYWTCNSPPSSEVPLTVSYNPIEYGVPPEIYNIVTKKAPTHTLKKKQKTKNSRTKWKKNLYGVKY